MTDEFVPRVVFEPAAQKGLQQGINSLAAALRPTLGPLPRHVGIEASFRTHAPEILDNGATIARRVIEIAGRSPDMGAMLLRTLVCRLGEEVGDGTATAAILFQSVYNQGLHYVTSGGDPMRLRRFLDCACQEALDALRKMSVPVEGQEALAKVARSSYDDPDLATMMGEIMDIIGEYGYLEIREGRGRILERQYVEGAYWDNGAMAREMLDPITLRTELENAAVLITDLSISEPEQLLPALEAALAGGYTSLLLIANELKERALSLVLVEQNRKRLLVVAVRTPGGVVEEKAGTLEDLGILTGGRVFIEAAGESLAGVRPEDFGRVRRAWAQRDNFGLVGGQGDARRLRAHIASLRQAHSLTTDADTRSRIAKRLGKLIGGSAILWVGAETEVSAKARKSGAEHLERVLRGAVSEGMVPGGGAALLACAASLRSLAEQSSDPDERAAYRILGRALSEPMRTIIDNAGDDTAEIMAQVRLAGTGAGYDATAGRVTNLAEAGIQDVAHVTREALQRAVATAGLALTVNVLVQHKNPQQEFEPR